MAVRPPKCCFPAKTDVPYEMREELDAAAIEAGCTDAELLRDIIYLARRGMTYGEHVANHRRSVLAVKALSNVEMGASE